MSWALWSLNREWSLPGWVPKLFWVAAMDHGEAFLRQLMEQTKVELQAIRTGQRDLTDSLRTMSRVLNNLRQGEPLPPWVPTLFWDAAVGHGAEFLRPFLDNMGLRPPKRSRFLRDRPRSRTRSRRSSGRHRPRRGADDDDDGDADDGWRYEDVTQTYIYIYAKCHAMSFAIHK